MKKITFCFILLISMMVYAQTMNIHTKNGSVNSYNLAEIDSISFLPVSAELTVTDIDGNIYRTVTIGTQIWMAENLKVTHYRNGDAIPNVADSTGWADLTTGAYCNYNNYINHANLYGRLYNWYAIDDSRGLAPEGWHVATDEEWKQLEMYMGMSQSDADLTGWRGTDQGMKLKSTFGWTNYVGGSGNGTDDYGFTALAGGYREDGRYEHLGVDASFWTASPGSQDDFAWWRDMYNNNTAIRRYDYKKSLGMSIRCVKDTE